MQWLYLTISIVAEVIATSALKASASFTRLVPSVLMVAGYGTAFFLLSLTLHRFSWAWCMPFGRQPASCWSPWPVPCS